MLHFKGHWKGLGVLSFLRANDSSMFGFFQVSLMLVQLCPIVTQLCHIVTVKDINSLAAGRFKWNFR